MLGKRILLVVISLVIGYAATFLITVLLGTLLHTGRVFHRRWRWHLARQIHEDGNPT